MTPIREPRLCKLHVVTRKKKVNNIYKQTKIMTNKSKSTNKQRYKKTNKNPKATSMNL